MSMSVQRPRDEALRRDQLVLGSRDAPDDGFRVVLLLVAVDLAHDRAHQPHLVRSRIDGEVLLVAQALDVALQHPDAQRVEGGEDDSLAVLAADDMLHPLLHLLGGLVGEGHGEDPVRRHLEVQDQVGDPVGDDAGFSGAGAGQDEQRPFGVLYRGELFRVESGQVEHRETS